MKKLNLIALAMLAGLVSAPAWAASPRTFVSATRGSDQGNCAIQWPCLTFNFAISKTSPGGEVIAVDSGSYAPVTIAQSVTIEAAPGVYVGITPSGGGAGVTLSGFNGFNTIGSSVVLRGLTIYGGGSGDGIDFNSGAALYVENCVINGVGTPGISYNGGIVSNVPSVLPAGELFVKDTVIRNCVGDGIDIKSGGLASLDRVTLANNLNGLFVTSGKVSVANSVVSGNENQGIWAMATSTAEINVESCLVANNSFGIGILSDAGTNTVRVSDSTVTDNGTGLAANSPGVLLSRSNNTVGGNGTPTSGTITPFSPM